MSVPQFRPLLDLEVTTTPQMVGDVPHGYFRRAGIVTSGTFSGDRLRGTVLPGGGDWLFRRTDGVIHLDVRLVLETEAGDGIYMTYTGRRKASPEVEERLARRVDVGGDEMYFRTSVQFEAAAPSLSWLNDVVAFGIGHARSVGPRYEVFELL